MGCRIIFCQAYGHQLIKGPLEPKSLRSNALGGMEVTLATYPRDYSNQGIALDDWMSQHVRGVLRSCSDHDLVLLADHDSTERFPGDPRLIRAEYSLPSPALAAALARVLDHDSEALDDLVGWFWANSPELPHTGIGDLNLHLGRGGLPEAQWSSARQTTSFRRALEWLALLQPSYASDDTYQLAVSLLANQAPVAPEEHVKLQQWLDEVEIPDVAPFLGYCHVPLPKGGS